VVVVADYADTGSQISDGRLWLRLWLSRLSSSNMFRVAVPVLTTLKTRVSA
jgi:hypothetical protein